MILALGLPVQFFYFLSVCCFAVGIVLGAVAVRLACNWLNRIGHAPDGRNVVPVPRFGRALLIAFVPILVHLGGLWVYGTMQAGLTHPPAVSPAAALLAMGLVGFCAMSAMTAWLCPAKIWRAVTVTVCVHGFGLVACLPLLVPMLFRALLSSESRPTVPPPQPPVIERPQFPEVPANSPAGSYKTEQKDHSTWQARYHGDIKP